MKGVKELQDALLELFLEGGCGVVVGEGAREEGFVVLEVEVAPGAIEARVAIGRGFKVLFDFEDSMVDEVKTEKIGCRAEGFQQIESEGGHAIGVLMEYAKGRIEAMGFEVCDEGGHEAGVGEGEEGVEGVGGGVVSAAGKGEIWRKEAGKGGEIGSCGGPFCAAEGGTIAGNFQVREGPREGSLLKGQEVGLRVGGAIGAEAL